MALPALVLALVALVAIAAGGSTRSGSGDTRRAADSLLDAFFTLGLVGVAAGGLLLVYGLTQRKAIARQAATGKYRNSMVGWVILAGVYAAVWYFRPDDVFRESDPGFEDPIDPNARNSGSPEVQDPTQYEARISWPALVLLAGLALAGVAAYVAAKRRSHGREPAREELVEQLAAALDDTLDDLRAEPDPRRAIIAAYARLERALAASGVPRRPDETAQEYVPRVLEALTVGSRAVERLSGLFTEAKFSLHEVDKAMKEEAIQALEQIRGELLLAEQSRIPDEAVPAGAAS